jgi:uncharacterized BrkB/YihY/UPF0761 family membrane protein
MYCTKCGKEAPGSPAFCPTCGARQAGGQPEKKRSLGTVAGILDIVSGVLALFGVFAMTIAFIILANDPYRHEPDDVDPLIILASVAVPLAILAILAIGGGIYALRRKRWGMALAGAIAAALPFSLTGIAALILTALSRDEFD